MADRGSFPRLRGLAAAAALSGAAALIYEVVWAKALGYWMGGATQTVSVILASFMAGMAAGAWAGGRGAATGRRALATYAALEVALAVAGATMPGVIAAAGQAYASVAPQVAARSPDLLPAVRVALFLGVLALPAVLMGATFPVACRAALGTLAEGATAAAPGAAGAVAGSVVARIYAINAAGAVVGCLAAGFALVPALGLTASSRAAAALNVAAAAAALAWRAPRPAASPQGPPAASGRLPEIVAAVPEETAVARTVTLHLFLSGFTAMVYEVAFTRLLPLVIGASAYAFTLMLAAFIAGIARGARALSVEAPARAPEQVLAESILGLGTTVLLILPAISLAPFVYLLLRCGLELAFWPFMLALFALVLPVMSYPAYHLGRVIPSASTVLARASGRGAGRAIGLAYAASTIGNVAGSLAAAWALIPGLGLRSTFVTMALINVASGLAMAREAPARPRRVHRVALAAALALLVLVPAWDPAVLVGGAFRVRGTIPEAFARLLSSSRDRVLFMQDDVNCTVSVQVKSRTDPPVRYLRVSGKVDASSSGDMSTQLLLGHLPLLLAPAPGAHDVLVIGLGSGVTAGAALAHPVRRVDVVEVSPAVVSASRFFDPENGRYHEDPRTRIVVDDARHHLALADRVYDVIISEPSNPWMAGIVNLYTREFFALAARRLAAHGIFCQWIHTYEMDRSLLASIVRTVRTSFPVVRAFVCGDGGDMLLIARRAGGAEPEPAEIEARARSRSVSASLARMSVRHPVTPFLMEALTPAAARAFGGEGPPITDDWPVLEYLAPRAFHARARAGSAVRVSLDDPDGIWRRMRPAGMKNLDEVAEAAAYTRGLFPAARRRAWLAALAAANRASEADREELREMERGPAARHDGSAARPDVAPRPDSSRP
jgi:predicted membrane-bound spermidine synthase